MPIFSTVPCSQLHLVSLNPEPLGLTSPPSSTAGEAVIWEWRSRQGRRGGVSPPLKQRHSQDHLLFSVPSLFSIFRDTPVGVLQQRIHLLLLILLTSLLSLNFSLLNSSKSVTTSFLQVPKFSWHLTSVPASSPVLFVLVDVCVFCCNVSTIILRLWGQGGNKCTCFQYHHPLDTGVLECGRYPRGGAEETAGSLQDLAWTSAAGMGFRASLRLAGCLP